MTSPILETKFINTELEPSLVFLINDSYSTPLVWVLNTRKDTKAVYKDPILYKVLKFSGAFFPANFCYFLELFQRTITIKALLQKPAHLRFCISYNHRKKLKYYSKFLKIPFQLVLDCHPSLKVGELK
jgi:hypothetical protein